MPSVELWFGEQDLGKYRLVKQETTVGRDPTADIVIDNLGISRFHCRFVDRGNIYAVEDLESSNGTFVNGKRIVSHNLNEGDEVVIGKYRMLFHYHVDQGQAADQGTRAVGADSGVMPDTLKTYVMDGKALRERMKQMEQLEAAKSQPVSAADYAAMLDPLKPRMPATRVLRKDESNLASMLKFMVIMNLILVLLIVLGLFIFAYKFILSKPPETGKPPAIEETGAKNTELSLPE